MTVTKIIIVFSLLIVLGSGVIGYGLYQRHERTQREDQVLSQVDEILSQDVAGFSGMTSGQRSDALERARRVRHAMDDLREPPRAKRAALAAWQDKMTQVHQGLQASRKAVRDLLAQLRFDFPPEAKQQLSPADRADLTAAVARVESFAGGTVPLAGGGSVSISQAFGEDVAQLRALGQAARKQLDDRERLYADFVRQTTALDRGARLPSDQEITEARARIQEWQGYARADPEKSKALAALGLGLSARMQAGQQVEKMIAKLQGLVDAVDSAAGPDAKERAGVDLRQGIAEAKTLLSAHDSELLRLRIIRAKNALAGADRGVEIARLRNELVGKLIRNLANAEKAASLQRRYILEAAARDIEQLKPVDSAYAAFFESVSRLLTAAEAAADKSDQAAKARAEIIEGLGALAKARGTNQVTLARTLSEKIEAYKKTDRETATFFEAVLAERMKPAIPGGPDIPGPPKPPAPPVAGKARIDVSSLTTSLSRMESASKMMSRLLTVATRTTSRRLPRSTFESTGRSLLLTMETHVKEAEEVLKRHLKLPAPRRDTSRYSSLALSVARLSSAMRALGAYVPRKSSTTTPSATVSSSALQAAQRAVDAVEAHSALIKLLQSGGGPVRPGQ